MKKAFNIIQLVNVRWYNACAHYAVALSSALQKKGHQVIVAGDVNSPPLHMAERVGLETFSDLYLSYQNPGRFFYNLKRLSDLIEERKIDLVNAHQGMGHFYAVLLKKFLKKNFVLVRTRGDQRKPKVNMFNRWLNERGTDGIITTAEVLYQGYSEQFNLEKKNLVNIPLGVDPDYFYPMEKDVELRKTLGITDEDVVIGILGRLSPVKGHRYFIQAAFEVLKDFKQAKFLIAGEDAQIKSYRLKEWVNKMGVPDKFIFIGKTEDPRKIISIMDIGVIASIGSETVCRVALEYMALGKPVIGTQVNGIPEVIKDGINGLIVKPEDSIEMAQAMLKLLKNDNKRERFGRVGRFLIEHDFSLETFATRTEEFYLKFFK